MLTIMLPVLLVLAAALLISAPVRQAGGRFRRLWPSSRGSGSVTRRNGARAGVVQGGGLEVEAIRRHGRRIRLVATLAGGALAIAIGGWPGVVLGLVAAGAADRLLRRLELPSVRREREEACAMLPLAAELIASALRSGSTVDSAIRCVAEAIGGALGTRLDRVAAEQALGSIPSEVWSPLADLPSAHSVVRAAIRSADSGAALSVAMARAAQSARAAEVARADIAARRAGVFVVLPVGLCFLPAFVLLGVVPVAAGVLSGALA